MPETFTPRYLRAFDRLIRDEGGYVNNPNDRGGATKFGVSLRFAVREGRVNPENAALFDLDMDGDIDGQDIRKMTVDRARQIYFTCFWERDGCESWPVPIGEMLFDQSVNGGAVASRKLLQRALTRVSGVNVVDDGVFGPITRAALKAALEHDHGLTRVINAYRVEAMARYRELAPKGSPNRAFLAGWLARAGRLGDEGVVQ